MKRRSCGSASSSSSSCIDADTNSEMNIKPLHQMRKPNKLSPKSRSSIYRGVTRHRWTGRFEAHLWDKSTWNTTRKKRGRQIYLGAYDNEEDAARTYDLAALKYWGPTTTLNFSVESYAKEIEEMQNMTNEEYLATLRRQSSGFSRGVSKYRGVARHHHNGRWEARIGRVSGNKYLYLGTYSTQEEAAVAYDMAAIEFRGPNAVTNFDISNYADKLNKILPDSQSKHEKEDVRVTKEVQLVDEPHGNQVPIQPCTTDFELVGPQAAIVMDPTEMHEHPWDLCLDVDFSSLPLPDIPIENSPSELLGWLDGKDFEDDIECIFDGPLYDNELFIHDALSGDGECKVDSKGHDLSTSHSSSSLSTMASGCSNI